MRRLTFASTILVCCGGVSASKVLDIQDSSSSSRLHQFSSLDSFISLLLAVDHIHPQSFARHGSTRSSILVRQPPHATLMTVATTALKQRDSTTIYDKLSGLDLARASDGERVDLTSLWRKDLAFGIGGERAVVVFLRHFG